MCRERQSVRDNIIPYNLIALNSLNNRTQTNMFGVRRKCVCTVMVGVPLCNTGLSTAQWWLLLLRLRHWLFDSIKSFQVQSPRHCPFWRFVVPIPSTRGACWLLRRQEDRPRNSAASGNLLQLRKVVKVLMLRTTTFKYTLFSVTQPQVPVQINISGYLYKLISSFQFSHSHN